MTLLTPELVEKAARAGYHSVRAQAKHRDMLPLWEDQSPVLKDIYRTNYGAALTAILPDIGESFAKVADRHEQGLIASAIRALAKGE